MRVTAEAKSATRQRILDAAQRQFVARGFEAATTRDIAREAEIAVGTLFNYFPTKEAIARALVHEAYTRAVEQWEATSSRPEGESLTFEEELFAHVAATLRKFKPLRKFLAPVLETALSPLTSDPADDAPSFRSAHLENVNQIFARQCQEPSLTSVALHLYWTLYTGVLIFWSKDASPRQEDTLALLDQSLAMFVGWLNVQSNNADERRLFAGE
jgi:AcrR family transcriptional regulator